MTVQTETNIKTFTIRIIEQQTDETWYETDTDIEYTHIDDAWVEAEVEAAQVLSRFGTEEEFYWSII